MLHVVVKLFTSHDMHGRRNGALLKTLLCNHFDGLHNLFLDPLHNGNFRNFLNDQTSGVAVDASLQDVNSAYTSSMAVMSACSECPWMITLGCPTYRANAARLRLANGSLLPLFSKGIATICFYTVSVASETVITRRIFLCLQEVPVALDHWCACLDL